MTSARSLRTGLLAALLATSALAADARELTLGLITPPGHVRTPVAQRIAETLPEVSGGTLTLAVFPAGQFGSEQEAFRQRSTGLLDAEIMTAAITSLCAPSLPGWFTPCLFRDVEAVVAAAGTPAAAEMPAELQAAGLHPIGCSFAGMRQILMRNSPGETPADLAGRKIRILPFPAMKLWGEAVGAVPTPVKLTEVSQSLQTGLPHGIDIDLDALVSLRFGEVPAIRPSRTTWPSPP